jgi:hypothetical protein
MALGDTALGNRGRDEFTIRRASRSMCSIVPRILQCLGRAQSSAELGTNLLQRATALKGVVETRIVLNELTENVWRSEDACHKKGAVAATTASLIIGVRTVLARASHWMRR